MKTIINELLQQDLSRRQVIVNTTKISAAVAASSTLPLPFTLNAADTALVSGKEGVEIIRHSACLVNCGSRCALKVIVKDDRIVRIEPEDAKDDSVFGEHQIRPCLRGRSSRWRVYSPDRIKYPMKLLVNAEKGNLNVFHGMRPQPLLPLN